MTLAHLVLVTNSVSHGISMSEPAPLIGVFRRTRANRGGRSKECSNVRLSPKRARWLRKVHTRIVTILVDESTPST